MKSLRRHVRLMGEDLADLFKHRLIAKALFPPDFDPDVLLDQLRALGVTFPKKAKRGPPVRRTAEDAQGFIDRVERIKRDHGFAGRGSDARACARLVGELGMAEGDDAETATRALAQRLSKARRLVAGNTANTR